MEEIDDTTDPVLGERGLIGINLREEDAFSEVDFCEQWVNRQLVLGGGRVECSLPCPPTLSIAQRSAAIRGGFADEQQNSFNDTCITTNRDLRRIPNGLICCYSRRGGRLIDHAQLGAGRSLSAEAATNQTIRDEEDQAHENWCLSETANVESCGLFSSVRPVCNSSGWKDSGRHRWGK